MLGTPEDSDCMVVNTPNRLAVHPSGVIESLVFTLSLDGNLDGNLRNGKWFIFMPGQ